MLLNSIERIVDLSLSLIACITFSEFSETTTTRTIRECASALGHLTH